MISDFLVVHCYVAANKELRKDISCVGLPFLSKAGNYVFYTLLQLFLYQLPSLRALVIKTLTLYFSVQIIHITVVSFLGEDIQVYFVNLEYPGSVF